MKREIVNAVENHICRVCNQIVTGECRADPEPPDHSKPSYLHVECERVAREELRNRLRRQREALERAATDLLAVCERIANLTDGTFTEEDRLMNLESIGEQARAAIAKARGHCQQEGGT